MLYFATPIFISLDCQIPLTGTRLESSEQFNNEKFYNSIYSNFTPSNNLH